jgi:hypothetical protein
MSRPSHLAILALLAVAAGCSDRMESGPTAPADGPGPTAGAASPGAAVERAAQDRLARRLALALAEPEFRAYLRDALDRSPVREHKLQLQKFLRAADRRALRALAKASGDTESGVEADARSAIALELYLPVPAHRAAWRGGADLLVATAREDHEAPAAFDLRGRRRRLSPEAPPATPVLAVVPVETDFEGGREVGLLLPGDPDVGGGGGGGGGTVTPPTLPSGLYMTSTHFAQDFEGWLKGSPEYEIHILGQLASTDSLTSYQCAGEHAGGAYVFDQNNLDWTGNVLLFSGAQLAAYKSVHPNQNVRILALEDDDGACQIRLDGNRFKTFQNALQAAYPQLTGGKDTTSGLARVFRRANALQKLLRAAYSWITSQDDLIGNAIEDVVVGEFHAGANWILRGDGNVTTGWLKLQMR